MGEVAHVSIPLMFFCCCYTCGVPIYGPDPIRRNCLENKTKEFFCVNGHSQHFLTFTELEKAQRELEAEKRRHEMTMAALRSTKQTLDTTSRSRDALKGYIKSVKERIANGVCPCCKRSFTNLRRHMMSKHPDYKESDDAVEKG